MPETDAIIVGGGYAGLSCALSLARSGLSAVVINNNLPRNAPSGIIHGLIGSDGKCIEDFFCNALMQINNYERLIYIQDEAANGWRNDTGFSIQTLSNGVLTASNIVLATGIKDIHPNIVGFDRLWGKSIFHCFFCNGTNWIGQSIGVLFRGEESFSQALTLSKKAHVTLFLNGGEAIPLDIFSALSEKSIELILAPVSEILKDQNDILIIMADGTRSRVNALFVRAKTELNGSLHEKLLCDVVSHSSYSTISVDSNYMTNQYGIYAIGDIVRQIHGIPFAIADGVRAAMSIASSKQY